MSWVRAHRPPSEEAVVEALDEALGCEHRGRIEPWPLPVYAYSCGGSRCTTSFDAGQRRRFHHMVGEAMEAADRA